MAGFLDCMNVGKGVGERGLDQRLTPLRTYFVQRLHRLIELKGCHTSTPISDAW
jgi:hypothetical protein